MITGSTLGGIVRPYEDPTFTKTGANWVRRPLHRKDDEVPYMRPDVNGELMVVARCGRHYVMQSQSDLMAGVAAPCDGEPCGGMRVL